jgi:hypothetical protein
MIRRANSGDRAEEFFERVQALDPGRNSSGSPDVIV